MKTGLLTSRRHGRENSFLLLVSAVRRRQTGAVMLSGNSTSF